MGKYDDPHLDDKRKNFKGLRGVRFYDVTDPAKIVKLSEFSTGATGQGTHRNYYDGGKYAYLDTAPDETFIHQPSYFRQLVNGNMIVDASDPGNPKEVSMWWVPGSRKGEEAEYNKWIWSKLVPPRVAGDQTPFAGLHGPVYVPKKLEDGGTRGYGAFGCNGFIILDLSDPKNQREIGRFEPPAQYSGMGIAFHTIYCGILERGFVLTNGETTNSDCNQIYLPNWIIDIRDEQHPVAVAQLPRPVPPPEAPYRDFCFKRGTIWGAQSATSEGARKTATGIYRVLVFYCWIALLRHWGSLPSRRGRLFRSATRRRFAKIRELRSNG